MADFFCHATVAAVPITAYFFIIGLFDTKDALVAVLGRGEGDEDGDIDGEFVNPLDDSKEDQT